MELKYNANASFSMKIQASSGTKQMSILFGVLVLLAVAAIAPHAAAYGIKYTASDNPYGPLQGITWGIGLGIAGLLTGVGVFTAVRRSH